MAERIQRKDTREIRELIRDVVGKFGPLTKAQVSRYIQAMSGLGSEAAAAAIRDAAGKKVIFMDDDESLIRSYPKQKINRKMIIAFWCFLRYARQADGRVFNASFPSQIGFATNENVCLITVCENKYKDTSLIALREKERDDVIDIIAGANIALEEVAPGMLPEGRTYIYVQCSVKNVLKDKAKLTETPVFAS